METVGSTSVAVSPPSESGSAAAQIQAMTATGMHADRWRVLAVTLGAAAALVGAVATMSDGASHVTAGGCAKVAAHWSMLGEDCQHNQVLL